MIIVMILISYSIISFCNMFFIETLFHQEFMTIWSFIHSLNSVSKSCRVVSYIKFQYKFNSNLNLSNFHSFSFLFIDFIHHKIIIAIGIGVVQTECKIIAQQRWFAWLDDGFSMISDWFSIDLSPPSSSPSPLSAIPLPALSYRISCPLLSSIQFIPFQIIGLGGGWIEHIGQHANTII